MSKEYVEAFDLTLNTLSHLGDGYSNPLIEVVDVDGLSMPVHYIQLRKDNNGKVSIVIGVGT